MPTTTMPSEAAATTTGDPRRFGAGATAVALGGVLVAAALALHLRGGGAPDVEFVRRVEAAPGTWLASHVLMTIGGVLLAAGLLVVPGLAVARGRRLLGVGSALVAIGALGTALGDFAHGALAYVLVDRVSAEQSLDIQEAFFAEPALALIAMLGLLLPVGMLVLGAGLLRTRLVPLPAALLLLFSPLSIQAGFMVTSLPMMVMVLPLAVGSCWLAFEVARTPRR